MPLEFTAIDSLNVEWAGPVAAIPLQAHEYMMSQARVNELPLLRRMSHYWEDAIYERDELEFLRLELAQLRKTPLAPPQQAKLLEDLFIRMESVIAEAQNVGGHVEAIAD